MKFIFVVEKENFIEILIRISFKTQVNLSHDSIDVCMKQLLQRKTCLVQQSTGKSSGFASLTLTMENHD